MEEKIIIEVQKEIDLQIAKVEKILDKRGVNGNHFDEFLRDEKNRLYGMLHIYWLIGGTGYTQFQNAKKGS